MWYTTTEVSSDTKILWKHLHSFPFLSDKRFYNKKAIRLKIRKNYIIEYIFLFFLVMQKKKKIQGLVPHNGKDIVSTQHMLSKENWYSLVTQSKHIKLGNVLRKIYSRQEIKRKVLQILVFPIWETLKSLHIFNNGNHVKKESLENFNTIFFSKDGNKMNIMIFK